MKFTEETTGRILYALERGATQKAAAERAAIEALVRKCLDAKGVDCKEWEKEIDERVAARYGL